MKDLNLSLISSVSIIDLGNGFSKAVYTFNFPDNLPIGYFRQRKVLSTILNMIGYLCGYFERIALKENSLILSEVEVIVPPIAEYLDLENKLKALVGKTKNSKIKKFSVSKGITIQTPTINGNKMNEKEINEYLKKFKINSNNN